jgi:hypothetical protein
MNRSDLSQVARRDQLLEKIRAILEPQLMEGPALSVEQHKQLQAAIANYTVDLLGEMRPSVGTNSAGHRWTADMT